MWACLAEVGTTEERLSWRHGEDTVPAGGTTQGTETGKHSGVSPLSPIHPCLQLPFANPQSVFKKEKKKKRRKEGIELGKIQEIKRKKKSSR